MIPRCAVFLSWAFLRCLWTNEPLRRSANALLGVVLQEIFAPFGSVHCLVLASLGLLAPFSGQAQAARLVCPLAMSITPSAVSRLAHFLGSNTFPPFYVPEYVLIPYQEVLLHRFPGMRSRARPPAPRRDAHRLELQPPLGQLVDPRSRGRRTTSARSSWRRRWARTLGLAWGRPALRSGKRSGPGSSFLATKSAHRSDGTLERVDRARRGTWTSRRS
jgi:hypothetical protein